MAKEIKKTEAAELTDEQIKELAISRGLIKVVRSEGQVAFEEAASRLNALEAEIFDLLQQADFPGSVEVRFGVKRDGEKFLTPIRTRKEYTKKAKDEAEPAPAPKATVVKKKGKKA